MEKDFKGIYQQIPPRVEGGSNPNKGIV